MLKKDAKGVYFVTGIGTARNMVRLDGNYYPVTYISTGMPVCKPKKPSAKRGRYE
tara:strand:+ start:1603 stop:1767 length:165 start_codon:yes stop_codon:yes gene_type:complete